MTLNEAIEHCKKVAKEQENCNKDCSLEHRQLAIWLSDLKAITENSYEKFKCAINEYAHDYTMVALQGRLATNPSISSKEIAKLVADDVKYLLEELALNDRYFISPKKYKMGALEDYINRVEKESGKLVAYWQLCTLESDYRRKYGRYPSKIELREYGNSRVEENFHTSIRPNASTSFASSSTSKNNASQPSEEELKILKSLELSKEKPSDDSVPNVSFNKAYKIWK